MVGLAMVALASGFTVSPVGTRLNAARTSQRVALAPVMAEEPDSKEIAIGAAWVGGLGGVYLFGQLSTALVIATAFSYGSTLTNGFGDLCKKSGTTAVKVYKKTLEINEEYAVLPKAKSAIDTITTVADNLNTNYAITAKLDEKLKLSQAVDKVTDKVETFKSSVTSKVDDLKAKASSS